MAGRLAAREILPLTAAFWRFMLASAVLIIFAYKSKEGLWPKDLPKIVWFKLLLLGASGMLAYNYFFIKGLGLTEAGRASVIVAINPCIIFLGTILIFGEKLSRLGFVGLLSALLGVLTAITHGEPWQIFEGQVGLGEILIFCCTITWATYSLLGRSVLKSLTPLLSTTWASIFGTLLLAPLSFFESGPGAFLAFTPVGWASLAFLGFFGTAIGFTLFYKGILEVGTRRAAIFINLVPIFGLLFGWMFLSENLDFSLLIGLFLVICGISLIQRSA